MPPDMNPLRDLADPVGYLELMLSLTASAVAGGVHLIPPAAGRAATAVVSPKTVGERHRYAPVCVRGGVADVFVAS